MNLKKVFLICFFSGFLWACEEPSSIDESEDPFVQNWRLIEKAREGDLESITKVKACLDQTPYYEFKERADYYWLLKLRAGSGEISDQAIAAARAKLTEDMARIIENWDQDPENLAPFTFARNLNC